MGVKWIYQTENECDDALLTGALNAIQDKASADNYYDTETLEVIDAAEFAVRDADPEQSVANFVSVKDTIYNTATLAWDAAAGITKTVLAEGNHPILAFRPRGGKTYVNLTSGFCWRWSFASRVVEGAYEDMYAFPDPTGLVDASYLVGVPAPHATADVVTENEEAT